ncbi:MAG TPA: hypothetical protein VEJ63_02155 [Planctomycetota bacterium]|nr:hypothetical protein [Planctomycetota bacterium]
MAVSRAFFFTIFTRSFFCLLSSAFCLLAVPGCRKAAVERHAPGVEPVLSTGEPAYIIRTQPPKASEPWYRPYQAVLDKKPETDQELDQLVAEKKPGLKEPAQSLMTEVRRAVEAQRKENDRWSIIAMTLGRPRKGPDVQFTADVGLTKLFARRPVIAFNNVPLDLGIAKLARETGIQDSIPRNYNPRVYWTKNNVSAYEAIDEILKQHGYARRFTDTIYRVSLRLQDYKSKEEFVEAAVETMLARGKDLNAARPALVVTPVEKSEEPAESSAEEKAAE